MLPWQSGHLFLGLEVAQCRSPSPGARPRRQIGWLLEQSRRCRSRWMGYLYMSDQLGGVLAWQVSATSVVSQTAPAGGAVSRPPAGRGPGHKAFGDPPPSGRPRSRSLLLLPSSSSGNKVLVQVSQNRPMRVAMLMIQSATLVSCLDTGGGGSPPYYTVSVP